MYVDLRVTSYRVEGTIAAYKRLGYVFLSCFRMKSDGVGRNLLRTLPCKRRIDVERQLRGLTTRYLDAQACVFFGVIFRIVGYVEVLLGKEVETIAKELAKRHLVDGD